jgi:hypothetical protein
MQENIDQPNKKKNQSDGDCSRKYDDVSRDDRQKARDEERDKRAADKNAEKMHRSHM